MSNTTTIESAGYIISNAEAIWGVGATKAEAWADFDRGMSDAGIRVVEEEPAASDDIWPEPPPAVRSEFHCEPATAALLAEIESAGGNRAWGYIGKVACTTDEADAAP